MNNSLTAMGDDITITTTTGTTGTYWTYPNYPLTIPNYQIYNTPYISYYNTLEPSYIIKVEKCENGFIIHKDNKKFVVNKPEDIAKYLKDENGKSAK